MKLIIYMPALNEGETIHDVIKTVPGEFQGISQVDILVINDGSADNTEEEAIRAGAEVINHKTNLGVGGAFQTAVRAALDKGADILCSIDADGQFDVNQIQEMINPIIEGHADFSIGNRFSQGKPSENMQDIKFWGNMQVNKLVSWVAQTRIEDASCGFRAYSREALISLNLQGKFTYTHETILDLLNKGFHITQVPVEVKYFEGRVSRVAGSISKYAVQTSKIIFRCLKDYKPLYFFGSIALVVFLLGFIPGFLITVYWLITGAVTPFKGFAIISVILCLLASILFAIAFLADMQGRLRENQEKILYLLKKVHFDG